METSAVEPEAVSGPGLVVFDAVTDGLCRLLHALTARGIDRILAVAAVPTALADGAAWRLLEAGVSDVVVWDATPASARQIAARLERWDAVDRLVRSPVVASNLVGQSAAWTAVLRQAVEVARFTDASILIEGETGTGKELVARLIHTLDPRPDKKDLIILDCGTIAPELAGSEFFGHERGAFTGAIGAREGAFALADRGTLFIDEVGELPAGLQAQLLRAVQERTYKRVGGNVWQRSEFRLISATNRPLDEDVAANRFRSDFYFRIATWRCRLPPLRTRVDDILPLAHHFIAALSREGEGPGLSPPVREYLVTRPYPGNVRELRQLVTRIMQRHVGPGPITVGDLPTEDRPARAPGRADWRDESFEASIRRALALGIGLREIGRAAEDTAVRIAIAAEEGNLQRAARQLGVTDRALQMRRAARRASGEAPDEPGIDRLG